MDSRHGPIVMLIGAQSDDVKFLICEYISRSSFSRHAISAGSQSTIRVVM